MSDALYDGRRLRALTVVDNYTRECLAIEVGQSLKAEDVVTALNRLKERRELPATIKVDNGSEFISRTMDRWAYEHGVELDFSRPGRPIDNAKVESFNGRFREECPLFPVAARCTTQGRGLAQVLYNEVRPHTALDWLAPSEFARRCGPEPATTNSTEPEISNSERL